MIDPGLKDKVVLVTGGNNPYGIGAAIAKAFVAQGAKSFIHFFRQETAFRYKEQIESHPQEPGLEFFYEYFCTSNYRKKDELGQNYQYQRRLRGGMS